jgi:hypothetical protein
MAIDSTSRNRKMTMNLIQNIQDLASPQYLRVALHLDSQSVGEYVLLYGQDCIEERNATYEVQLYMPCWVTIGDDSGGQAILMKLDGSHEVYLCDHGAIGSLAPELIHESFEVWYANGCPT